MQEQATLSNKAGVKLQLHKGSAGWGLGSISLHGKPIDSPLNDGLLFLRNRNGSVYCPVPANEAKRIGDNTLELRGKTEVNGVALTFQIKVALDKDKPVVYLTPSWKVEKNLPGWEVCFTYHNNQFTNDWRVQCYTISG